MHENPSKSLLPGILAGAKGDDEELQAFCRAFQGAVEWPVDAHAVGEPVAVLAIRYEGNVRRGLIAICRGADGQEHVVGMGDVRFAPGGDAARYVSAYREWLGLELDAEAAAGPEVPLPMHKVAEGDLDLSRPVELVALSVKDQTARCRPLDSTRILTLRSKDVWKVAAGEILTVRPGKHWTYAGHPYLSGEIERSRIDAAALGLVPLRLEARGDWDPKDHYWGEEGEPLEDWAKPIMVRGPRQQFEFEHLMPFEDPEDWDSDPILEAVELERAGDRTAARERLCKLTEADLRCLDAHAHLGNLLFKHSPTVAIRHYESGVRVGELSLPPGFDGVLAWGYIENRPFLRCMHGFGLCLWRLKRFDEAAGVFDRMLWYNPSDNQGIRMLIDEVRRGESWEECEDGEPDA